MENTTELLIRIGEMLDEKLEQKLEEKLEQKLDEKLEQKLEEKLDKKLDEKLDKRFKQIETSLNSRLFLFEQEYGTKIDAIYDAVILEQQKNIEKSDKIRKLDKRLDSVEANIFSHEKRISNLERNQ